jgi:CRP-like cAMP-binding protein
MAFLPTLSHAKKPTAIMSPKRQMKHGSVLWLTVRKSIPAFISRPLRRRFRRQRAPHFMIDPETKVKMAWDVLLTCCVMYTTCVVPYRVCFKRDATGGFATFESVLDLFFGGDIVLNFLTGVQLPSGEVTYDTATVARTYLRGWFLVDFFSTIPFDDLSDWFGTTTDPRASKALSSAKLLRSLKVLRLFKLARIRKLTKLFLNLEDAVFTNQSLLSLTKLALTMLFLSHLVACLWFAIGNQAPSSGDSHASMSWVYEYEFQDREPALQYLVSVYWAIVTMVTIGYGDVLATNNFERLFNIAIMAIGVSFFGYVIGTITTLVSNLDVAAALYDERLTTVKEYIISRSIPAYMSKRIRDHFEYFYQNRSVFKEKTILNRLPTAMRNEMIHHIHAKVVARVQYFRHCHESLISAIVMSMRPFNVLKDEYVYGQHEIAAHVFFLLKGKVHLTKAVTVTMAKGRAPGGEWRLATLSVGEHFGELEVYDHEHGNGVRICSAIAKSYCELTFLSRQAITKISASWPEVLGHFKDAAKDTSKRMRRRVENSTTYRKSGSADEDHGEGEGEDEDDESDAASRRLFHDEEMEQKMATSTLLAHKTMLSRPHPASSRVAPYIRSEIKSKSNTESVDAAARKKGSTGSARDEGGGTKCREFDNGGRSGHAHDSVFCWRDCESEPSFR